MIHHQWLGRMQKSQKLNRTGWWRCSCSLIDFPARVFKSALGAVHYPCTPYPTINVRALNQLLFLITAYRFPRQCCVPWRQLQATYLIPCLSNLLHISAERLLGDHTAERIDGALTWGWSSITKIYPSNRALVLLCGHCSADSQHLKQGKLNGWICTQRYEADLGAVGVETLGMHALGRFSCCEKIAKYWSWNIDWSWQCTSPFNAFLEWSPDKAFMLLVAPFCGLSLYSGL